MPQVVSITVVSAGQADAHLGPRLWVQSFGNVLLVKDGRLPIGCYFWPWTVTYSVCEDESSPFL